MRFADSQFEQSLWCAQRSIFAQLVDIAREYGSRPQIRAVKAHLCSERLVMFDVFFSNGAIASATIPLLMPLPADLFDSDIWSESFYNELTARPRCLS